MNHETICQIIRSTETLLNSKNGPFYAGLIALSTFSFGYLLIENKYGIFADQGVIRPQLDEQQIQLNE